MRKFNIINISKGNNFKYSLINFLVTFILVLITRAGFAQYSNTLYFMPMAPQSGNLNPAYVHDYSFYLGLPGIGAINTSVNSNFLSYNDVFIKHPVHDSIISFLHPDADLNDFIKKLKDRNLLNPEVSVNLFMLGFKAGKSFLSFQITERTTLRSSLPKDIIELGLLGSDQFVGRTADFSKFGIDFSHFREYSLGFSTKINNMIQIGAKGKILFGKGSIQLETQDMSIYTDPDTHTMLLRSKLDMNVSAPLELQYDVDGNLSGIEFDMDTFDPLKYLLSPQNMGFAFDAGIIINPIRNLSVSASIVDFGFIKWNRDVKNISMDGEFEFNGFDFSSFFEDGNEDNPFDVLLDSIAKVFDISDTQINYTTWLGTKIYLGANYQLTKVLNVGLLSKTEFYRQKMMESVTLSANLSVGKGLSTNLSYSIQNNTYDNIGLGLGFRGGPFLLYMVTDNVTGFFFPKRTQTANVFFGLNLVFGYDKEKKKLESRPII